MYTMNFAALNTVINNNNVGKKHDSYQRRLNKLKQRNIVENTLTDTETPLKGNKSKSYNIIPCLPDLESFLNDYETSRAYKCYNKLNNLPTTLTLGSGDTSYNFGGYIDDLTIIRQNNYSNYDTGTGANMSQAYMSGSTDKITFFIDFEINTTINDLSTLDVDVSSSSFYTIFEIGKQFRGTSLILHKDTNENISIEFFSGNRTNSD